MALLTGKMTTDNKNGGGCNTSIKDRMNIFLDAASGGGVGFVNMSNKPKLDRATSAGSTLTAASSNDGTSNSDGGYGSPKILKKKIAKAQAMMKEEEQNGRKGRDSKKYKSLAVKVEQYEAALAEIGKQKLGAEANDNNKNKDEQILPQLEEEKKEIDLPHSPSTTRKQVGKHISTRINKSKSMSIESPKKPAAFKKKSKSVSLVSPVGKSPSTVKKKSRSVTTTLHDKTSGKKRSSASSKPSPDKGKKEDKPEVTPQLLQRKLKKVDKMIEALEQRLEQGRVDKQTNKDIVKLSKKRDEYKTALKRFESKMISQFLKGNIKNVIKSQAIVGIHTGVEAAANATKKKKKSVKRSNATKKEDFKEAQTRAAKQLSTSSKGEPFSSPSVTKPTTPSSEEPEKVVSIPTHETGPLKTATISRRPSRFRIGPRRKSSRVSATRIFELDKEFKPPKYSKANSDQNLILAELKRHFVFKKLNAASLDELVQAFEPTRVFKGGEIIIQQGDDPPLPYFYIIGEEGGVDYLVDGMVVGNAETGASFGENSLLYNSPRKATVRASGDTSLFQLDQITFRYVLQNQVKFKTVWRQSVKKVMAMNRLLGLGGTTAALCEGNIDEAYSDEDDDNGMNRLMGSVVAKHSDKEIPVCSPSHNNERKKSLRIRDLTKVDDSPLKDGDDSSSNSFKGSMRDSLDLSDLGGSFALSDVDDDDHISGWLGEMSKSRMSLSSSFHERVSLSDFNRESVLGEGQFGEVWKARPQLEGLENTDFALKIQAKEDMMRETMNVNTITVAEAIDRECNILAQLIHPFVVEFVHRFEDDQNIYLVMGIIKGVELWSVIHRELDDGEYESGFEESQAKFYGVIIADTLRHIHRQKICYRDMKPENVMIDETGYPIIVDFGFAKEIPDGRTFTFCGTPQYTCPEVVANLGHGFAVVSTPVEWRNDDICLLTPRLEIYFVAFQDWWAFGIVLYEMVSGENPFYYDGVSPSRRFDCPHFLHF